MTKISNHPLNQPSPLLWSTAWLPLEIVNKYKPRSWILSSNKQALMVWEFVEMKIWNLQSLLVCPIILWKISLHWRWPNFWLTVRTGISDLDLVFAFHFSPLWMNGAAPLSMNSTDSILEDKVLMMTHLDLQKRFPDIPCVSQMLGGPCLRLGIPVERLSIPPGTGWGGNDTGQLVTWEFPLRIDSASWKSFETFIQFISFCNSCIRPESSKKVFWSSTKFRLAIVSNVELWNFLNSSISVRLRCWASRNSNFCCHNCPWRSRRSDYFLLGTLQEFALFACRAEF